MARFTHIKNSHDSDTVTPRELLKIGLDPAVVWNVDRDKKIKSNIFIVSTLINGYSEHVVSKLVEYFGEQIIMQSLNQYKNRISDQLFHTVKDYLNQTQHPV